MGKISDALERHQNERAIKTKMLHPASGIQKPVSSPATAGHPESSIQKPATSIQQNFDPKLVVCSAPGSVEAENFKILKSQILFTKDGSKPKTIMITSAFPGEGKTFVAANLAASLAQGVNEHALLIDCDLHNPDIHSLLGYDNKMGLQDYLTGKMELPDLLIRTGIEKLSLLTAGSPAPNASEWLSSSRMKEFFEEVKGRYQDRYVIIDTAPSHIMAEVSVLANYVDAIIFVIMAQKSPREIIRECIEKFGKEKILGIVFNGYDKAGRSYEKYYSKYYSGNKG